MCGAQGRNRKISAIPSESRKVNKREPGNEGEGKPVQALAMLYANPKAKFIMSCTGKTNPINKQTNKQK